MLRAAHAVIAGLALYLMHRFGQDLLLWGIRRDGGRRRHQRGARTHRRPAVAEAAALPAT
ncbi:hypothetical protein [Streptomyces sp. NPDC020996]|uniref:hypothetical protein n=1 Tax=Streptomyces sp. NPDC020996 TaxID=3154791 RepID=UPI0033CFB4CB